MKDNIRNAFDYHQELGDLKKVLDSIDNTLEYLDNAFEAVDDSTPHIFHMSLSMSQADLRTAREKIQKHSQ